MGKNGKSAAKGNGGGKPNKAELKRAAEMESRLASLCAGFGEGGFVPAASGLFDLDEDNRLCKGVVALSETGTVAAEISEDGRAVSRKVFEAADIESCELRKDFGVLTAELVLKTGEVRTLFHVTPGNSAGIIPVVKSISDMLSGMTRFDPLPGSGATPGNMAGKGPGQGPGNGGKPGGAAGERLKPNVCPKCGKPLKPGEKTCVKCFDKKKVLKKMMSLATPHWAGIIFSVIISFVLIGVNMATPAINRSLVDDYVVNEQASAAAAADPYKVFVPFALTVLLMLCVRLATLGIGFLKSYVSMKIGLSTVIDIRKKLFAKIQNLSMKRVEEKTTGELMVTVSGDSGQMQGFVNNWLPSFIQQVLMLIVVSVVTAVYDWKLLVIFLLPMPVTVAAIAAFHKHARRLMGRQREASSKTSGALHDILSGIRVVKAYGTEAREHKRFGKAASEERDVSVKTEILLAVLSPFISIGLSAGTYFLLFYTGNMILSGSMTIGECAMFSAYAGMIYEPLGWLANFPSHMLRVLTSANRIFGLLEEPEEDEEERGIAKRIEGHITFENVSFGYEETSMVLKNIDLEMKPGEMIGLVGRSGVGKSTLINLIMRLYEPSGGRILIDGTDILDYDRECLRSQLGAVLQETVLVSGSLYENLVYAKPGATVDEVLRCSKLSGVHDFAVKLPDGYNTKIGEKGYTLSGGERQRVAIARAILRDPRILILDEATSSLDTEMEKQVQDSIGELVKDRTTVAIAHRLSTLRNASKIVVLDAGRIAEIGTHKELMEKKGLYYELVIAQRQTAKHK
ncbi:MAG: ATP-binding cassette domain-containing protein [Clostridia bacterium]|nr:ATP-binding cassette domain-containing protein [Clostridia bacterium]